MTAKPKSRTARLAEIERQVGTMKESHLSCRELRHQWDGYTARYMEGARNIIERTLKCKRCGGERDQQISGRDGSIIWSGNIVYPEGYLFKDVGRLTGEGMDIVRLASVTNQLFKNVKDS